MIDSTETLRTYLEGLLLRDGTKDIRQLLAFISAHETMHEVDWYNRVIDYSQEYIDSFLTFAYTIAENWAAEQYPKEVFTEALRRHLIRLKEGR